jgi:hypothetical protein
MRRLSRGPAPAGWRAAARLRPPAILEIRVAGTSILLASALAATFVPSEVIGDLDVQASPSRQGQCR